LIFQEKLVDFVQNMMRILLKCYEILILNYRKFSEKKWFGFYQFPSKNFQVLDFFLQQKKWKISKILLTIICLQMTIKLLLRCTASQNIVFVSLIKKNI
jgi:hypothetical protein